MTVNPDTVGFDVAVPVPSAPKSISSNVTLPNVEVDCLPITLLPPTATAWGTEEPVVKLPINVFASNIGKSSKVRVPTVKEPSPVKANVPEVSIFTLKFSPFKSNPLPADKAVPNKV